MSAPASNAVVVASTSPLDFLRNLWDALFAPNQRPYQVSLKTLAALFLAFLTSKAARLVKKKGLKGALVYLLFNVAKSAPGLGAVVGKEVGKARKTIEKSMLEAEDAKEQFKARKLPKKGLEHKEILKMMKRWSKAEEAHWKNGQVSGGIYHGGRELQQFCAEAYGLFALANPLHPEVFPFVRKMESETVSMCLDLFNAPPESDCCGVMTSGGTESILLAMRAYQMRGRARGIEVPEIIAPITVHAAFNKAAEMFGMKLIQIPVEKDFRVDMRKVRAAITPNTVVLVGSAPCYPQGTMDAISQLSALAVDKRIGLHVDCCLGGLLLPFVAKLPDYDIPLFDFRLKGVSSISADTHKYGYAPKGSSVLMYSSEALRRYQYFMVTDWTGGIYATPTIAGSRPGGLVAAAWAAMVAMGEDGYMECAAAIMKAAKDIEKGIDGIEGIRVLGNPVSSVVSFAPDDSPIGKKINIFNVSEAMSKFDWHLNTLQNPASVHICCTYLHKDAAQRFIDNLRAAVKDVIENPQNFKDGSAALYGMAETIQDNSLVEDIASTFLDTLYRTEPSRNNA